MLETFFHAIGYGLCHQMPDRSFISAGFQLPVCARDTGIYVGFVLGLVVLWLLHRTERPTELPRWPVLVLMGLFVAAMGYDGVTSYAGLRETSNDLRLATGMLTGWTLSGLTVPMVNGQIWSRAGTGRILDTPKRLALWLVSLVAGFAVAQNLLPKTGVFYPLFVSAAIIVTFVCVNLVFVGLMPPFERRAARLRDTGLQIAIAFALTAAELAGAAWLRWTAERILT